MNCSLVCSVYFTDTQICSNSNSFHSSDCIIVSNDSGLCVCVSLVF